MLRFVLLPHPVVGSMVLGRGAEQSIANNPKQHAKLPTDFLNNVGELSQVVLDELPHHLMPVVVVLFAVNAHRCVASDVLQGCALQYYGHISG